MSHFFKKRDRGFKTWKPCLRGYKGYLNGHPVTGVSSRTEANRGVKYLPLPGLRGRRRGDRTISPRTSPPGQLNPGHLNPGHLHPRTTQPPDSSTPDNSIRTAQLLVNSTSDSSTPENTKKRTSPPGHLNHCQLNPGLFHPDKSTFGQLNLGQLCIIES